MSVEVVIKNKQLIKKPLTIEDITMGKYACGTSDQYMRNTCEVKDGDIVNITFGEKKFNVRAVIEIVGKKERASYVQIES